MVRSWLVRALCVLSVWSLAAPLLAITPDRDFSGNWILMETRSDWRALGAEPEPFLTVTQDDRTLTCKSAMGDRDVTWTYGLDGRETKAGGRNSLTKWEGAALLINTLVSTPENYTVMDRWRLSADRATLTITRQIVRARGEVEGKLVYRRAGARVEERPTPATPPPAAAAPSAPPVLTPRPAPARPAPAELVVPAGTRILLELVNPLNTGKSKEGDHVYLRTVVPVSANDRIAIPPGSSVIGTITASKPVKGKRDLYIRFDSLTLPDGTTRDLRSRPEGGKEGKVAGQTDTGREVRTVAAGAGIGASIGSIAGAAGGHAGAGAGIGGLAGAAAGLASIMSKRQDITLRAGTQVEMALDRDLRF
jgi:hypothetical protein